MTDAHESTEFREFLVRLRQGDQVAAEELVTRFEPLVRRKIREQMEDRRLARLFDSMDFSQSVFASFVFRAIAGEYQLDDPRQLTALLLRIARNKLASKARWQLRDKREARRDERAGDELQSAHDPTESPSQIVATQELVAKCCEALTVEERRIIELRGQDFTWHQIGQRLGQSPDAVRMQLKRATQRITAMFGLDD